MLLRTNIKEPSYLTLSQLFVKLKSSKNVYFFVIHSYINYGDISLESTYKTKLKKIFTYQKRAARVVFFADRLAYAKPLILDMNALNIYQINICQHFILLDEA